MSWKSNFTFLTRDLVAVGLRNKLQRDTAVASSSLGDRSPAGIRGPRSQVAEYAGEAAPTSVRLPPMSASAYRNFTERLKSWRRRRAAISQLSSLDDRLLRDIGIERGQIEKVVDAKLNSRRALGPAQPVIQLAAAVQQDLVPVRHHSETPVASMSAARAPAYDSGRSMVSVGQTSGADALRSQAANEGQLPERRYGSAANS